MTVSRHGGTCCASLAAPHRGLRPQHSGQQRYRCALWVRSGVEARIELHDPRLTPQWYRSFRSLCRASLLPYGLRELPSPPQLLQTYDDLNVVYTSRLFQPMVEAFDGHRFQFVGRASSAARNTPLRLSPSNCSMAGRWFWFLWAPCMGTNCNSFGCAWKSWQTRPGRWCCRPEAIRLTGILDRYRGTSSCAHLCRKSKSCGVRAARYTRGLVLETTKGTRSCVVFRIRRWRWRPLPSLPQCR